MNNTQVRNGYAERSQEAVHNRNKSAIASLNELIKDVALVKYRRTLDEVAKTMTRISESDRKSSEKCQELQNELSANQTKLRKIKQKSEEDKKVLSALKSDLQTALKVIENLKLQNDRYSKNVCIGNGDENSRETDEKANKDDKTSKDKYELLNEIEKGNLQVFELEEELAYKEKSIEDLSMQLEDTVKENVKLKSSFDKMKAIDPKAQENKLNSDKTTARNNELKLNQIIDNMKQKLLDIKQKDQKSLQRVKCLIKKNKILSRQLQTITNQNNLMKLQLTEQKRLMALLSCQFCKLDEKDKKQAIAIGELENIRNQHMHMIDDLEQEIYELKKICKF